MRVVLFLIIVIAFASCEKVEDTRIEWENGKATSVWIRRSFFEEVTLPSKSTIPWGVGVRVTGNENDILGVFDLHRYSILFRPDVPLERGQTYDVFEGKSKVVSFTVPPDSTATPPRIIASYPSCDTVPENLLKIYLVFDQPMREGKAYDFIHLIDQPTGDTIKDAFLDLQPELWNLDQTILTVWLDPGRIKRDLIPNKTLGAVLSPNKLYQLRVNQNWKSKKGLPMNSDYQRGFVSGLRDSRKPDVTTWKVTVGENVHVSLRDNVDWSLLTSVISVWSRDEMIQGAILVSTKVQNCESEFRFIPENPLPPGTYRIEIESRLEDLAGNNLNRLFETDVTTPKSVSENKSIHTIGFIVR